MRRTCLDKVYDLAQRDERVVFIGSDLGAGVLDDMKRNIPDRFFMEGVAEQNLVGMAAGLAMEGLIPYVNTIATFLTRRCFEQVAIDLCLHDLPVRLIANGGGVLITMSSWAANRGSGNPKLAAYAASKAALGAVTKTMARAHARDGVLGYCIAPGTVRTDMSVRSARNQGGEDAVTASLTMGEWVPPREVADLVAFLASGTRRHLSGATLDINGASYIR